MGLGTVLARNCKITTVRRQNCLQQVMYDKTSIYFLNVSIDYSALYQYLTTEKVTPENKVKPREHFFFDTQKYGQQNKASHNLPLVF